MKGKLAGTLAAAVLLGGIAAAQSNPPQSNPGTGQQQQNPQQQGQAPSATAPADKNGVTLDNPAPPPVNPEEEAAVKAFQDPTVKDPAKKIQMGEDFLQKYPQSRYRPMFYSTLTQLYLAENNPQKALEVGQKEVELNPNDVQVLAVMSRTIPRVINKDTQNPGELLAHAEQYGKRAIEVAPTLTKPEQLTDDQFAAAKNAALSDAYSGLGVTYFRLGKYPESISNLQQAIKLDEATQEDPVNFYILGLSNEHASHFDDAAAAFGKCAAMTGPLAASCKASADDAKKKAGSQLSAPK